jgi:hypothetical protein
MTPFSHGVFGSAMRPVSLLNTICLHRAAVGSKIIVAVGPSISAGALAGFAEFREKTDGANPSAIATQILAPKVSKIAAPTITEYLRSRTCTR